MKGVDEMKIEEVIKVLNHLTDPAYLDPIYFLLNANEVEAIKLAIEAVEAINYMRHLWLLSPLPDSSIQLVGETKKSE